MAAAPVRGAPRSRSDFDSHLTIVDGRGNWEVAQRKVKLWAAAMCAVSAVNGMQTGKRGWDNPMADVVREVFQTERGWKTRCDLDKRG